jgi:hypothetical protein
VTIAFVALLVCSNYQTGSGMNTCHCRQVIFRALNQ